MEIGIQYTLADSYPMYREASTFKRKMTKPVYFKITDMFLKFMMNKLFEGHEIALGAKLGSIYIGAKKVEPKLGLNGEILGIAISWSKTKVYWEKLASERGMTFKEFIEKVPQSERPPVYCFNEHTNGYAYTLRWVKEEAILVTKSIYSLRFARANKRRVTREVLSGTEYVITTTKD
jgi:hypothetical protein